MVKEREREDSFFILPHLESVQQRSRASRTSLALHLPEGEKQPIDTKEEEKEEESHLVFLMMNPDSLIF